MSGADDRSQLVRQLAAQGWSESAIAAATHMSVEQVALALGGDSEQFPSKSPPLRTQPQKQANRPALKRQMPATGPATASREGAGIPQKQATRGARTAEDFGRATFERLAKQRARLQAEGALLRAEIERLAEAHGGPRRGIAQLIQPKLSRPVALRTVQEHLTEITRTRRQRASA